MPLPIIAGDFQIRHIWTSDSAQRPAVNDIYVHDNVGGLSPGAVASVWATNYSQNMGELVGGTNSRLSQVRVTPLDGVTAGVTFTNVGAKFGSGSAADPILQGCAVVTLQSARRGPRGRGRVYLPWVPESGQAAGVLSAGSVATLQTAWNQFMLDMANDDLPLQVVSPTYNTDETVLSVQARPFMKTQRRRARR